MENNFELRFRNGTTLYAYPSEVRIRADIPAEVLIYREKGNWEVWELLRQEDEVLVLGKPKGVEFHG